MRKLKVLTLNSKETENYWIIGIFENDDEVEKYAELFFTEDDDYEVEEVDSQMDFRSLPNGEYVYNLMVVNPDRYIIEGILAPEGYEGPVFDRNPKMPLKLTISAKDAVDLKQKYDEVMRKEGHPIM